VTVGNYIDYSIILDDDDRKPETGDSSKDGNERSGSRGGNIDDNTQVGGEE